MKIIFSSRQTGKTTQLIKMAAKNNYYIVCASQEEAYRIAAMARDMNLNIPFPISYYEFINRKYHAHSCKSFLIDNVDLLVHCMTTVPIHAITLTQPKLPMDDIDELTKLIFKPIDLDWKPIERIAYRYNNNKERLAELRGEGFIKKTPQEVKKLYIEKKGKEFWKRIIQREKERIAAEKWQYEQRCNE